MPRVIAGKHDWTAEINVRHTPALYPYSSDGWGIPDFLNVCEAAGFLGVPDFNINETPQDMADSYNTSTVQPTRFGARDVWRMVITTLQSEILGTWK